MKTYAGIGSRNTPPAPLEQMTVLAQLASQNDWMLRSGGAIGADSAFEIGCDINNGSKEIFLPWKGYNNNRSLLVECDNEAAQRIASTIHKRWSMLSQGAKKMMTRNVQQILGQDLKHPVDCVICYTDDGCESIEKYSAKTGGTGLAISLASVRDIPIFNLKNNLRYEDAEHFLLHFRR